MSLQTLLKPCAVAAILSSMLVSTAYAATTITVDNLDTSATVSTGSWNTSGGANPYLSNSQYSHIGTYQWSAVLPNAGEYTVEAYWTGYSNRTQQANYAINHGGGTENVVVNQRQNGGQWVKLGTYSMNAGAVNVEVSNLGGSGTLSADAVRFTTEDEEEPVIASTILVDSLDSNVSKTGYWAISGGANPFANHSEYSTNGSITWQPEVDIAGRYDVQVYWTGYSNRTTSASYTINHAEGVSKAKVNQKRDGGQWISLGAYHFEQGIKAITLANEARGTLSADAIRLVPADAEPAGTLAVISGPSSAARIWSSQEYDSNALYYHYSGVGLTRRIVDTSITNSDYDTKYLTIPKVNISDTNRVVATWISNTRRDIREECYANSEEITPELTAECTSLITIDNIDLKVHGEDTSTQEYWEATLTLPSIEVVEYDDEYNANQRYEVSILDTRVDDSGHSYVSYSISYLRYQATTPETYYSIVNFSESGEQSQVISILKTQ